MEKIGYFFKLYNNKIGMLRRIFAGLQDRQYLYVDI